MWYEITRKSGATDANKTLKNIIPLIKNMSILVCSDGVSVKTYFQCDSINFPILEGSENIAVDYETHPDIPTDALSIIEKSAHTYQMRTKRHTGRPVKGETSTEYSIYKFMIDQTEYPSFRLVHFTELPNYTRSSVLKEWKKSGGMPKTLTGKIVSAAIDETVDMVLDSSKPAPKTRPSDPPDWSKKCGNKNPIYNCNIIIGAEKKDEFNILWNTMPNGRNDYMPDRPVRSYEIVGMLEKSPKPKMFSDFYFPVLSLDELVACTQIFTKDDEVLTGTPRASVTNVIKITLPEMEISPELYSDTPFNYIAAPVKSLEDRTVDVARILENKDMRIEYTNSLYKNVGNADSMSDSKTREKWDSLKKEYSTGKKPEGAKTEEPVSVAEPEGAKTVEARHDEMMEKYIPSYNIIAG